jgi:hypothetical protein
LEKWLMNSVTVELDQNDLTALNQLLDIAVKAGGLAAARPALAIFAKLEAAVAMANAVAAAPQTNDEQKDAA